MFGIIVAIIFILIIIINQMAASLIEVKIKAALEKNQTEYLVKIGDVGGNIFFGNIRLKDIEIKPDSNLLQSIKDGTAPTSTAFDLDIPLIRIVGIGMYDAIVNSIIEVKTIQIKRAKIKIYKGKARKYEKDTIQEETQSARFNLDSIYLKNVSGISLEKIALINIDFQLWDIEKDKEILSNKLSKFELTGFYIHEYPDTVNVFYLDADELKVHISGEEFDLPGGEYKLSLKSLDYAKSDSVLRIKKMKFKPIWKDKFKMAAQWKFTKEIFDVEIDELNVYSFDFRKLFKEGAVYVDSIAITRLNLDIFKDKRYPFDESKRPKLPQQLFKTMKMPLYIGLVKIYDSKLIYKEKNKTSKDLLTVVLGSLSGEISFITSLKDSISTKKSMKIKLRSKMMNKPLLTTAFELPLYNKNNVFYFSGTLTAAPLKTFNPAAFPALGIKFTEGNLKSLTFKASATDSVSNGEMTMLYENLKTEVIKKDHVSKNKFLSWAANTVVKTSNPGKSGKIRVAVMGYDRDMYKGFMNLVWKTLQTGITNSILPASKQVKKEDNSPSRKELKQAEKEESQAKEETSEEPKKEKRKKKKKKNNKK